MRGGRSAVGGCVLVQPVEKVVVDEVGGEVRVVVDRGSASELELTEAGSRWLERSRRPEGTGKQKIHPLEAD